MAKRWRSSRFDSDQEEPLGPMANLLDLMLVFACGLIAALIGMSEGLQEHFAKPAENVIERGRELPQLPGEGEMGGDGYEAVGRVYRDSKTGKLILIGEETRQK